MAKTMTGTAGKVPVPEDPSDLYPMFEAYVASKVLAARGPLFTTDATGLFAAYLAGIRTPRRQHYNCNGCRKFIERYGGLVTIDDVQVALDDMVDFVFERTRDQYHHVGLLLDLALGKEHKYRKVQRLELESG